MLSEIVLNSLEPCCQLRQLRSVENDDATTAICHDISSKQLACGMEVQSIADIASEIPRIVGEAGNESDPSLLSSLDLRTDVASRARQCKHAGNPAIDGCINPALSDCWISLIVDREKLPSQWPLLPLPPPPPPPPPRRLEQILADIESERARHYGPPISLPRVSVMFPRPSRQRLPHPEGFATFCSAGPPRRLCWRILRHLPAQRRCPLDIGRKQGPANWFQLVMARAFWASIDISNLHRNVKLSVKLPHVLALAASILFQSSPVSWLHLLRAP